MGLRAKIGIAIAATAAVVAVLIGVLVHNRTVDAQFDLAAESIDGRLQSLVQDRAAGVDSGRAIVNPPDLPAPLKAAVQHGKRGVYLEPDGPKPHLWAATELDGDIIALKRPYLREQETLRSLDRVLWMAGIAGTALGCVVGLLVAHRLGRRLTASAGTAQRIAEGDLTARLPLGGKDEIAQLTTAVNTMADALAARLQAERDVTANIAHELRTPVAGLVAAAGLLPPSRPTELVQDRAQHVRGLMEDVLEVARLDARTEQADTELRALGELARRTVGAMGAGVAPGLAGGDGDGAARRAVDVRVLSDGLVETDPAPRRAHPRQPDQQRAAARRRPGDRRGRTRRTARPRRRPRLPGSAARPRPAALPHGRRLGRPRARPRPDHRVRPGAGARRPPDVRQPGGRRGGGDLGSERGVAGGGGVRAYRGEGRR
ncbi:hypothetical protein SRIMM317S_00825 [Streptomyces rimosus subsp. rimosus]